MPSVPWLFAHAYPLFSPGKAVPLSNERRNLSQEFVWPANRQGQVGRSLPRCAQAANIKISHPTICATVAIRDAVVVVFAQIH
jgi:hypothetical protein